MRLEYANYVLEKNQGQTTQDLIGYLQSDDKNILKSTEEEGKYQIDIEKLLNKTPLLGTGTDGKDVYMLEEVTEGETGSLGKIASTEVVKLAEATSSGKTYKVMYYGKTESENLQLDTFKDGTLGKKEMITFTVKHGYEYVNEGSVEVKYIVLEYQCEKGMTWEEFIKSKYNNKSYIKIISTEGIDSYDDWTAFDISDGRVVGWIFSKSLALHCNGADVSESDIIDSSNQYNVIRPDVECVYPNSNILVSKEGKTMQAKNIQEGENIAYYNFDTRQVEIGKVEKAYIHKQATNFVRYEFEDGSYLEATDYHPIYTKQGWKSYTRRNGYEIPEVGDEVKTEKGWKKLTKIESFEGLEDCYDFVIIGENGEKVDNYFANGTLVQGSY